MNRKKITALALTAAISAAVLAGCGSSAASSAAPAADSAADSATTDIRFCRPAEPDPGARPHHRRHGGYLGPLDLSR